MTNLELLLSLYWKGTHQMGLEEVRELGVPAC